MTSTFRLITSLWLTAGLGLVGVAAAVRVVVWARSADTSCPDGLRELLQWMAAAGSAAMALHLGAMIRSGSGTVGACAATAIFAAVGLAVGWWGVHTSKASADRRSVSPRRRSNGRGSTVTFPNYTQITSRIPVGVWQMLRAGSLVGGLVVGGLLITAPATGLFVMWRVVIPSLPLLFMVAPGLWRNLCPLAAANQTPRALKITRSRTPPAWLKEYGYVIAFSLFFMFVALRRLGLDTSGGWSALLLLGAMSAAFAGGIFLKGKSGWCSTICPLLPVQRIYGQTPLVTIANAHCQPCVGCVKNCYDFNPRAAYLADLNDPDAYWAGYRRLFVAAFPGLVFSFFVIPHRPALQVLAGMALDVALSITVFTLLQAFVKTSVHTLTTLFGAIAFSIFYWFAGAFGPIELTWLIRLAAIALAATWLVRTLDKEKPFFERFHKRPAAVTQTAAATAASPPSAGSEGGPPEVRFLPDDTRLISDPVLSLLELAEANGIALEAGCRMGICGADPVAITKGMACTSPISEDEQATLDRLGLAGNTRMACCVRVSGPVTVSLTPDKAQPGAAGSVPEFAYDPAVQRVVIVGNGISGVTAADQLRRRHPEVNIDLIADEPHHLYNRMGISRLVYGRSAMQGLYLNPDSWYTERTITTWLNTRALAVDRDRREVHLGTGETLSYDRLILTTGSRSHVPPITGFGLPGTSVLRCAADAMDLRAFAQHRGSRNAVVAGGGLLGLEAAHALNEFGMTTVVLERSERLLRRQLDPRASELLRAHLEQLGLTIMLEAEVQAADGSEQLEAVELRDGRRLPADVLLVAAGVQPNTDLAQAAGLQVHRGIVVDDQMRTDDPTVYAAGDVAEFDGQLPGLWASAAAQAEVAAENIAGGDRSYTAVTPATTLKVAGIDLTSIGQFEVTARDEEAIVLEDPAAGAYRKLVIANDRIVGAILLGAGNAVTASVRAAIARGHDITACRDDLRTGRWEVLG